MHVLRTRTVAVGACTAWLRVVCSKLVRCCADALRPDNVVIYIYIYITRKVGKNPQHSTALSLCIQNPQEKRQTKPANQVTRTKNHQSTKELIIPLLSHLCTGCGNLERRSAEQAANWLASHGLQGVFTNLLKAHRQEHQSYMKLPRGAGESHGLNGSLRFAHGT